MSEDPTLDCNRTNADLQAAAYSLCPSILLHTGKPNKLVCERMIEILVELRKRAALNEGAPTPFDPLTKGERLVPKGTPEGPPEARIVWADAQQELLIVVKSQTATQEAVVVGWMLPRGGRVVTEKIAEKYERADGRPIA